MRFLSPVFVFLLLIGWVQPASAEGFDPKDLCYKQISQGGDIDKLMMAAWVFGYMAGSQGDIRPVDIPNATTILGNLARVCSGNSQLSLLEVVSKSRPSGQAGPGGKDEARALLERFLQPDADLADMTMALKPDEADIRAVYGDPLAGQLIEMYDGMYQPGVAIGPKPDQDSVILIRTLTDHLIKGDAVLGDFPGGYAKVVEYMNPGVPIVRFKFVTEGEDQGMAFDGLIHVNDHWVLMPKPWRALD